MRRMPFLIPITAGCSLISPVKEIYALLEQIEIEPSNLSQQLAVLRRAGLVVQQRHAGEVVYAISIPEVRDLLLAARHILRGIIADRDGLRAELDGTRTTSPAS